MKTLTETVKMTKYISKPVGTPIDTYQLSEKAVTQFLHLLDERHIVIDPVCSEKSIHYEMTVGPVGHVQRDAIVPYSTSLVKATTTNEYFLRDGRGIELWLRQYEHITTRPAKGIIGGSIGGDFGIACDITITGNTIDSSIVEKVEGALRATYQKITDRDVRELRKSLGMDDLGASNVSTVTNQGRRRRQNQPGRLD